MTNYIDDDRPSYEYHHELEGLRKQNDQLREMVHQLRSEINGYRGRAEEAEVKMRQMEEARAGVTGARLYLKRNDGIENVVQFHYTVNGTRPRCHYRRADITKYDIVELTLPPEGLCDSCALSLKMEIQLNEYKERYPSSEQQSRRQKTTEQENAAFFKLTIDPNPMFTTYVYFIQAEGENRFKVGISTNPRDRIQNLRHAAGRVLKVLFLSAPCTTDGARSVEYAVKREYDSSRVAQEWYILNRNQVKRVKEIITNTVAMDRNKKHHLRVVK